MLPVYAAGGAAAAGAAVLPAAAIARGRAGWPENSCAPVPLLGGYVRDAGGRKLVASSMVTAFRWLRIDA